MTIFKAYDVRGIYSENLSEKDAYLIGYYICKQLDLKELKIAHDLRLSHESLTKFLIQGILDANSNVVYLGKSSTPNFYYSLFKRGNSGIMITASHNPKEYNGFKFIIDGDSFDSRNGLYDLKEIVEKDEENKLVIFEQIKNSLEGYSLQDFLSINEIKTESTLNEYINFLENFYSINLSEDEKNILKENKISLDFSSGMSSLAVKPFLERTKIEVNYYNDIPDGSFPIHSPDPSKAKDFLEDKIDDKGIFTAVFDGDGDRILFYDENKELVLPDYGIASLIDFFSINSKKFVCDLRSSRVLTDIAKEKHLDISLIRVGRAFYKDYMDKNNCIFGAELSGHLFFRDFHNFDNPDLGLIFMLKIIASQILEKNFINFSTFLEKYKTYHKIPETNLKVKDADLVFKKLKENYSKNIVLEIDGISFDFKDYWFNIRKSNTEPVVRLNFEGNDKIQTIKEFDKLIKIIKNI
ncbi:MAG: hypothetical protein KC550_02865 [Nanoarchaeota archaeon]|nr:hypothetical protein [Nanoarchaeota archaeon]